MIPTRAGLMGTLQNACTASTCKSAGDLLRRIASAAASTGMRTPVSLFTSIMLTRIVSPVMARSTCSDEICPVASGIRYSTVKPSRSSCSITRRTEGCSTAVVTIRFPRLPLRFTAPNRAILFASVPPEVK